MTVPPPGELPLVILGWVLAVANWIVVVWAYRRWSRDAAFRAERRYDAFISVSSIWVPLMQVVGATALALAAGVALTVVLGPATGVPLLVCALACAAGTWYWIRILRTAAPMPGMLDDPGTDAPAG